MKIKESEQGTQAWLDDRKGHLTASQAQCIATGGKGLETYCYSILAEKYSSNTEHYTNADMERGNELEDIARSNYEILHSPVTTVGFCEQDEFVGCSPDGFVSDDGGIEIKCPNDTNYFKVLVNGEKAIESKYRWQCKMCMLVTGRKWWDLTFFNPNFEKSIIIFRIDLDNPSREKLLLGLEKGKKLLVEIEEKFNQQK
jgi:putative phage-type endonuclease